METARPPGPRGHWLTGNVAEYDRDRIAFLRRHHGEHGDVFSFDDRTVFTIDPRLTQKVLAATNRDYVTEPAPFAGPSGLHEAGEMAGPWMRARRAVRPALAGAAATAMDGRVVTLLDTALDRTAGRDVDVLPVMLDFAGRAVAELCLGQDTADIPELLAAGHAALLPFEDTSYQPPAWLPSPRKRRFLRVHHRMTEMLTRLVRARRAGPARRPPRDLLDVLLGARPAMTDESVTTTLWSVLIGGHGVPAAALTSIVRELALRPGLVACLADEAGPPAGAGPPPARLPLAEAVVRETLRLAPPAWMMTRVACAAVTLGRWRLRPGDEVLPVPYLIHRDPRWWPRPEEFDPSRWRSARPMPGTYLPFGSGPRYCLGAAVAMRQLVLATSRIAQRFGVVAPGAATAEPAFRGRLAPAGLRAGFHPHSPGGGNG